MAFGKPSTKQDSLKPGPDLELEKKISFGVKSGAILDDPLLIEPLKKGEMDYDTAVKTTSEYKTEIQKNQGGQASYQADEIQGPIKVDQPVKKSPFSINEDFKKEVYFDYINKGEILDAPELLDAYKAGKIGISEAINITQQYNRQMMQNGLPDTKQGLEESVENAASEPGMMDKAYNWTVDTAKTVAGVGKLLNEGVKNAAINIGKKTLLDTATLLGGELPTNANVISDAFQISGAEAEAIVKEGATFGVYDANIDLNNAPPEKVVGYIGLNLLSSIPTSILTSAGAGAAARATGLAKTVSNLVKVGELSTNAKKAFVAKNAAKALKATGAIVENAAVSGAAGYARGVIKKSGDQNVDPLLDAINDFEFGGVFTAGALAVGKTLKTAANVLSKGLGSKSAKTLARTNAKLASASEIFANDPSTMQYYDNIRSMGDAGKIFSDTQEYKVYEAIKRYDSVEPFKGTTAQIQRMPQLALAAHENNAKKAAEALFIGSKANPAPLAPVYQSSPDIKALMDAGRYSDALDTLPSLTDDLLRNKTFMEAQAAPYMFGPKDVADVRARVFMNSSPTDKYSRIPNLKSKLIAYFDEPTPENANALLGLKADKVAGQKKFSSFTRKDLAKLDKFKDMDFEGKIIERISASDADEVSTSIINGWFDEITNSVDSAQKPFAAIRENVGNLKNSDDIFRAATSLNRDFHRAGIKAYANYSDVEDAYFFGNQLTRKSIPKGMQIMAMSDKRRTLLNQRKGVSSAIKDIEGKLVLDPQNVELKQSLKASKGIFRSISKDLGDNDISIKNISDEILSEADGSGMTPDEYFKAVTGDSAKIYMPNMDVFNPASKGAYAGLKVAKDATVENFGERFEQNNLVFIKERSDLADALVAMNVSGLDVKPLDFFTTKGGTMSYSKFLNDSLGENNPISTQILDKFNDAEVLKKKDLKNYQNRISSLGIRPNTIEDVTVFKIADGKIDFASKEFTSLPPESQRRVKTAVQEVQGIYSELLGRINNSLSRVGLPTVPSRKNYITHLRDVKDGLSGILGGKDFLVESVDDVNAYQFFDEDGYSGIASAKVVKDPLDPRKTSFAFEISRTGGKDYKQSAVEALNAYLNPALDRIHFTDTVRKIDFAKKFAPENLQGFLQDMKMKAVLGRLDSTSKGSSTSMPAWALSSLRWYKRKNAEGRILGNLNNMVSNSLSTFTNMTISAGSAVRGAARMFSRNADDLFKESRQINLRHNPDLDAETFRSYAKSVAKGQQVFDQFAAKHAFMTGYDYAIGEGLGRKAAVKFADNYVAKIQAGLSRVDAPMGNSNPYYGALMQFQSYTSNLFTSLAADIPNLAKRDSTITAVNQMVRFMAGASIANEFGARMGMRDQYDMQSFIPGIGMAKFGVSGPLGSAYDLVTETGNVYKAKDTGGAKRAAYRIGKEVGTLAVPTGGQLAKGVDAFLESKEGPAFNKKTRTAKVLAFGKFQADKTKKKSSDEKLIRRGFKAEDKTFMGLSEGPISKVESKENKETARKIRRAFGRKL